MPLRANAVASERERLEYASELTMLYRHNSHKLRQMARLVFMLLTMANFLTTLSAVLLSAAGQLTALITAGSAADADDDSPHGFLWVPKGMLVSEQMQSALAIGTVVIPMVSALLIVVMSRFAFAKRYGMLTIASGESD